MIAGVLLAAGIGSRFGGHKLLCALPDGTPMAVASARRLVQGVGGGVAVIRPGDRALEVMLAATGLRTVVCGAAEQGMGASIAAGIEATRDAEGWVVALGDMPFIEPTTIQAIAQALRDGASLAAPIYRSRRGHPVGFSREWLDALLVLSGDVGARDLLTIHAKRLVTIETQDAGTVIDLDLADDLKALLAQAGRSIATGGNSA